MKILGYLQCSAKKRFKFWRDAELFKEDPE